uniref:Uncharacterized protein n=1 Tax=Cyprinus carpio TaxID=7962 RepID=A0A8C1N1H5_CYPCA
MIIVTILKIKLPKVFFFLLLLHRRTILFHQAFSTYDPQYCYILDGILLLYCILITAFFVRERVRVYNKQTNTHTRTLSCGPVHTLMHYYILLVAEARK